MPTLPDLYAYLKALCDDLYVLRISPRPSDADWRHHARSLERAEQQRDKCRTSVDVCLTTLDAVRGQFPASWLGHDPQASKYLRLKRSLGTICHWLNESPRPFRGYKMPMDSDAQEHDDPADVKDWNDAELTVRKLADELRDHLDLEEARTAQSEIISSLKPVEVEAWSIPALPHHQKSDQGGLDGTSQAVESVDPAVPRPTPTKPGVTYSVAEVLETTGVSDTTLNESAKLAGVKTPGRGKRNHRYTGDELRKILQTMIDRISDRATRERCRDALAQL